MPTIILSPESIIEIHDDVLKASGGLSGICPDKSLDAALYRIEHYSSYGEIDIQDILEIAAFYAFIIAQGHIFIDGNKRTALISMYTFLELNNYLLNYDTENEIANLMVNVAENKITRKELKKWLKDKCTKIED